MTDYERLLEEAGTVGDSLEAMHLARRLATALREVMAERNTQADLAARLGAEKHAALAIIGKIRCVVGKAGTDDDVLDAVRSALADVEAMRAVVRDLPHCCGPWIRGSGGHREHGTCDRIATHHDPDPYWYCDDHAPKSRDVYEVGWADAVRALDARGKEPTR